MSAFDYKGPSIFSKDRSFTRNQRLSQAATKSREEGKCGYERVPLNLPKSLDTNPASKRFAATRGKQ